MSRKLTWLESLLLSLAAAWSVVGCICTAFQLEAMQAEPILLLWVVCALLCTTLLSLRRGVLWLIMLNLLAGLALWHWEIILEPGRTVLGTIAKIYDDGYGWGIPTFLKEYFAAPDYALALLGAVTIEAVSISVCCRKGTALGIGIMVLPLAACLVVTDTVPGVPQLFTLLLCLALLLLTDSVRSESGGQGTRLAMAALIPAALCLGLLFYLVPQETYENKTGPIRQQVIAYLQDMPEKLQNGQMALSNIMRTKEEVNLAALSSQPQLGLPVAEITAEQEGPVYLRVKDYDSYTGTAWLSTEPREETLVGTGASRGAVVVRELSSQSGMLLPAYPASDMVLSGGSAASSESVYRVDRLEAAMGARPGDEWLLLPEQTKLGASSILSSIPGVGGDAARAAEAIAEYVRGCAIYDRRPGSMPADQEDFALWFLRDAERGYCVHFATAAAVLLRAAGIPARYVTGYRVEAISGQTIKVTSNDAHAWVEYYNYQTWTWSTLEATPGQLELTPAETEESTAPLPQQETTADYRTEPETHPASAAMQPEVPTQKKLHIPMELVLGLACALLLAMTVELQRVLRIRIRRGRQLKGDTNHRAVERYRELLLLTKLTGRKMPEVLTELVEKALYSQHTLEKEELNLFAGYAGQCRRQLRKAKFWRRVLYRYWYAVI